MKKDIFQRWEISLGPSRGIFHQFHFMYYYFLYSLVYYSLRKLHFCIADKDLARLLDKQSEVLPAGLNVGCKDPNCRKVQLEICFRSRLMRRTIARYLVLAQTQILRMISIKVNRYTHGIISNVSVPAGLCLDHALGHQVFIIPFKCTRLGTQFCFSENKLSAVKQSCY